MASNQPGYEDPSTREQPRFTLNLGAQYAFGLGDYGSLTPRLDMFYQTDRTNGGSLNLPETSYTTIPGYALFNARITYATNDGKWTAALSAENLFNKFYYLNWFDYQAFGTVRSLGSAADPSTPAPPSPDHWPRDSRC